MTTTFHAPSATQALQCCVDDLLQEMLQLQLEMRHYIYLHDLFIQQQGRELVLLKSLTTGVKTTQDSMQMDLQRQQLDLQRQRADLQRYAHITEVLVSVGWLHARLWVHQRYSHLSMCLFCYVCWKPNLL